MAPTLNGALRLGLIAFGVLGFGPGCGETETLHGPVDTYCDFSVCPDKGLAEGNANVTNTQSVNAFFASVLRYQDAAGVVNDRIRTELDAIGATVGAAAGDDAGIEKAVETQLGSNVDGTLTITPASPSCGGVSASALLAMQATCRGSGDPPVTPPQCYGRCAARPGITVACGPNATLTCTGAAPGLSCADACQGKCDLEAAAPCAGVCRGDCDAICTVKDSNGRCAGTCSGNCTGTCELHAPAPCSGRCEGVCTDAAPSGQCDAAAQATCEPTGTESIDCEGTCTGRFTPPPALAPCDFSAETDASVRDVCAPPALNVSFQLKAADAADARAMFAAWLEGFKGHVSNVLALRAKLDVLVAVGNDLGANAQTVLNKFIGATLETSQGPGSLQVKVLLACSVAELPVATDIVEQSVTDLKASQTSTVTVLGPFVSGLH